MIFSLYQVAEKVSEKNQVLFMVFLDLTLTFDTINRKDLWKILKKLDIPDNILNMLIYFHEGIKSSIL